jgi:SPP1 gp7 family putative phage head morphogenesis protein
VVSKAFRGIAVDQAERFNQVVRQGLLTGEPTPGYCQAARSATLQFGERSQVLLKQLVAAGGQATAVADNQIVTLVRTSINQVANAASQQVYEANQDITKKYRYVATLDTRTSSICRALDGKEFEYGKGPTPPQHFNCRSTTVPVIDYDELGFTPPPPAKRASAGGQVPADQTYGDWLANKQKGESDADLLASRQRHLGAQQSAKYFQTGLRKIAWTDHNAIAKLVRDDGSELTLEQLRARYGPA